MKHDLVVTEENKVITNLVSSYKFELQNSGICFPKVG
jgi:hypothetical protein